MSESSESKNWSDFLKYVGIVAPTLWAVIQILSTQYLTEAQKYFVINLIISLCIAGYIRLIVEKKKNYGEEI